MPTCSRGHCSYLIGTYQREPKQLLPIVLMALISIVGTEVGRLHRLRTLVGRPSLRGLVDHSLDIAPYPHVLLLSEHARHALYGERSSCRAFNDNIDVRRVLCRLPNAAYCSPSLPEHTSTSNAGYQTKSFCLLVLNKY
ncbi:hypothetical protein CC77DRAFT_842436 [Alternaria alternata]|uniref:Uncharacterized protein n=1 Tax=Alternaria alternata TaxID=5599 RepID=A0A177DN89_ALTAL|nr:hypothetical protein CC77DRAFT_842436 [Alternaria alternata]OAG20946.1 hypothetical protein CC77DRAFT_842436 [Alternaria alternata]